MKAIILVLMPAIGLAAYFVHRDSNTSAGQQPYSTTQTNSSISIGSDFRQEQNGVVYFQPADRSYNLIKLSDPQLEFAWQPNTEISISKTATLKDWQLAINGGYFYNQSDQNYPAGLLQIKGSLKSQLVMGSTQTTHVLVWDHISRQLSIRPTSKIDVGQYSSSRYSLLQTGPLIIRQGKIATNQISRSLNGNSEHLRTAIGIDQDAIYLVISRYSTTLPDLAAKVMNSDLIDAATFTLINLDGGTSTTMYSKDLSRFNYGENKHLPAMIGVF